MKTIFGGAASAKPVASVPTASRQSEKRNGPIQRIPLCRGGAFTIESRHPRLFRQDHRGKLGDNALYREALKGAGNSSVAAFVDVQKLLQGAGSAAAAGGSDAANLAPIKAIGVSTTASGTSSDTTVRIIIK